MRIKRSARFTRILCSMWNIMLWASANGRAIAVQQLSRRLFLLCALAGSLACQHHSQTTAAPSPSLTVPPRTVQASASSSSGCQPMDTQAASTAPVTIVGAFTNVERSDDEHAYGYTLSLWRQGNTIFGLFSVQNGVIGDPPTSLLEEVEFDPQTRALSFKVRLSIGLVYDGQHEGVPSRDVFRFKGTLGKYEVKGVLNISNDLLREKAPQSRKVVLWRSRELTEAMQAPQDYAQWRESVNEILTRLGAKW
jgi:hypothetical protein